MKNEENKCIVCDHVMVGKEVYAVVEKTDVYCLECFYKKFPHMEESVH